MPEARTAALPLRGNEHGKTISSKTRAMTLGLLTAAYFSSYADRQILAILQEGVKADLALTDTQLGLLSGPMFAVFYATLAVPVARISESVSRYKVIATAVAIWSLMTAVCGLAQNFWQLALGRVGVGIGEAGSSPASVSLISDLYPPEQRASAMAIFSLGPIIGAASGLLAGGVLSHYYGWRVAMIAVGLPGILLALLIWLLVPEPRRATPRSSEALETKVTIREGFRTLKADRIAMHLLVGFTLISMVHYSATIWGPSFMQRSLGLSVLEISRYIAIPGAVMGMASALAGGWIADRVAVKNGVSAQSYVVVASLSFAFPLTVSFFYFVDNLAISLTAYFVSILVGNMFLGITIALLQFRAPSNMRAIWAALTLLTINLVGLVVGPVIVGQLSDAFTQSSGSGSLRMALIIVTLLTPWPIFHYWRAAVLLRRHELDIANN